MIPIEQSISPLVESMFPSFYSEEGPNFIAFMKAYYEWLETPTQTLDLSDATGLEVGDVVTQAISSSLTATGTVLAVNDNQVLVQLTSDEHFRSIQVHGVLTPITCGDVSTTVTYTVSDNIIYHSRNITNYRDIDNTVDAFILHFKEKYLKNVQFDTATNKKLLVKNSFDLYRSKGTARSVDLFFKLVYGINAEVYYPGDDLFRLSDGVWTRPQYLEVTGTTRSIDYVGKQITGVSSGATAFVEKFIKRRIKGGVVSILYISNPVGEFINNEVLKTTRIYPDSPRVIGSLNRVEIITGSREYEVGDIVTFTSTKGDNGKARVTEIANTTGVVDFLLVDGGWGYTTNAESIVSEKVITLANVETTNTQYFKIFENIYQPMANISFISANTDFEVGDLIYRYHANNLLAGAGYILTLDQTAGANTGDMRISVTNGSFTSSGRFYAGANVKQANASSYGDKSAWAMVCGVSTNAILTVSGATAAINSRIEIYQGNSSTEYANAYVDTSTVGAGIYTLQISNTHGAFQLDSGDPIRTRAGVNSTLVSVQITVGLYDIANTFLEANAYTIGQNTTSVGISTNLSDGYGAGFSVGSLGETETIFINTDFLAANNVGYIAANSSPVANQEFMTILLSEFAYGFDKNPQGNSSSIIYSCLNFQSFELGEIGSLTSVDPGADYNVDPFVMVYQPYIAGYERRDYVMDITGATRAFAEGERILQTSTSHDRYILTVGNTTNFEVGELVRQGANVGLGVITSITSAPNTFTLDSIVGTFSTTGNLYSFIHAGTANVAVANLTSRLSTAKGIVQAGSNSTTLFVKRIQFNNEWVEGETIVGQTSGAEATIVDLTPNWDHLQIGLNANVEANVVTSNGTVTELEIYDSGFGYSNGEIMQYNAEGKDLGEAKVIIDGMGVGEGYFKSSRGFLSDNKYIHDSYYYQEYSYDIVCRLPFEKYADVFKKVMHTAGTAVFGSVVVSEEDTIKLTYVESEIEQV